MPDVTPQIINTPTASTTEIRSHFPALERSHAGYPVAYFDGPGGTQVPREVATAMVDYLYHHNANTHWAYPTSEETDAAIADARQTVAEFLNARAEEIAFGANMTTLAFHVSRALGPTLNPGDEVVVTELDHHANIAPWRVLERERGVEIKTARLDPDSGQIDWEHFSRLVGPRTKLVAFGAASNSLGTVNNARSAVELAHAVGALAFIDAVHYVPHYLADVRDLDCDFLACSAYKFYGPHIGILYGKQALLERLDFPKLIPAPDTAPERAETGTQNQEGMVGAAAAVDFLAGLSCGDDRRLRLRTSFDELHARGKVLIRRMWAGLAAIEGVRLYGPPPDAARTPTLSFIIDGMASTTVSRRLAERGLFLSHGDFYAATVTERLGLGEEGLVRAGCSCYTTADEVERLIEGVRLISSVRI